MVTPQEIEFVRVYLLNNMNGTKAAMEAFAMTRVQAQSKAHQLLKRQDIVKMIQEEMESRIERLRIDADFVLQEAVEVYRRCMQKTKQLDKFGQSTGEYKFDPTNALKALQLIGQHIDVGAFEERKRPQDDEDLVRKIRAGRQRLSKMLPLPLDDEHEASDAMEEEDMVVIDGEVVTPSFI